MPALALVPPVEPADLPHVWRVDELAMGEERVLSSGHAALDAQLPGGGWPLGGMVELLQAQPASPVWPLLLPALAQVVQQQPGPVVLVAAPFEPFGPGLSAQGLPGERLLCVRADKPGARLWAAEQALRCAEVAAVLAWLPQARSADLRRLHLAAQQQGRLLFVMRTLAAQHESSPARLRLWLQGTDSLQVHLLKRRGPPLLAPLVLPLHAPLLAALLAARRGRRAGQDVAPAPATVAASAPALDRIPRRAHALARIAAA
ncbi:MAG: translesion DNA synthesis-associated protein ImuA [Ramlibacter sp.]|nr:translesion DNA synthesis-associated protein ImuA [Ramlibacter sp.]